MAGSFDSALPPIISRERAEAILKPYSNDLCDPCFYGINCWRAMVEQEPERAIAITPRVWSGIVHCYIVRDGQPRFENKDPTVVRVRPENESLHLIFDEVLVARWKKVKPDFRPSNSQTERQYRYDRQDLKLDGLPDESTNITIGYMPNAVGTEIERITAICWRMHRLEWVVPLYEANANTMPLIEPQSPDAPAAPERRRIIRAVNEPKKAEGQGE